MVVFDGRTRDADRSYDNTFGPNQGDATGKRNQAVIGMFDVEQRPARLRQLAQLSGRHVERPRCSRLLDRNINAAQPGTVHPSKRHQIVAGVHNSNVHFRAQLPGAGHRSVNDGLGGFAGQFAGRFQCAHNFKCSYSLVFRTLAACARGSFSTGGTVSRPGVRVLQIRCRFLYDPRMEPSEPEPRSLQSDFFASLGDPLSLLQLFEFLPEVYLYVKDCRGRYVRANRVVCRVVGVADDQEMIGRTDFDFFPPAIASQYQDEDRRVIESAAPLTDQIWLVPDANGVPQIYLCNKVPLVDRDGTVIGIAGVKRPYRQTASGASGHARLMKVVEFVTTHFAEKLTVADLAERANLSPSQLHREFAGRFGITPNQYIREVRIGVARHLLESDQLTMAQVAAHCGFYDQSHFSRQFRESTGLAPLQYRKRFNSCS